MYGTTDITRPWTPTVWPEALPRALFVAELVTRGLTQLVQDEFPGAAAPDRLAEVGEPVLVRADPSADEVEAFVRLPSGDPVLVDVNHGEIRIEVGAETLGAARSGAAELRRALATEPQPESGRISVAFWMNGARGPQVRHREIDAPELGSIATNYEAGVRAALERLAAMRAPEGGSLILWRGAPGTGKSHALRALARAWSDWCTTHFVMDPEELFGRGGAYMLDLLTWDDGDDDRWRLVALEDAGELIAADARAVTGQALSRLLNVTDGILGQGTRTIVLITTNEPVGRLHPATRRPGRCLADVEFKPLAAAEANAWLAAHGHERRVDRPTPLAELFGDAERPARESGDQVPFGFGRVLASPARTR
ncbi:MAG TPA: DUF5925 domain-containing protein [Thermoleophilaceae bacterium]